MASAPQDALGGNLLHTPFESVDHRGVPPQGSPRRAPLGRDASDATPVAFLLSDAARAVTGQVLHVDGGFSAVGA
ncbi:SDR family oxidoreductase [Streptomyces sp. AM6-12]|uniref:SDR family oxidoreductase n=1 Tax=Streptomyces sp. AM6-12 TaxID=3345149 RepID=UPI0037BDB902